MMMMEGDTAPDDDGGDATTYIHDHDEDGDEWSSYAPAAADGGDE